LNSAVRAPPICRKPVGEGANRVTTAGEPPDCDELLALKRAFLFSLWCDAMDERP
jgi:hypothetical protein